MQLVKGVISVGTLWGKRLFISMDVTFHEWEPYYKNQDDLAQFLEEFSPATEGDSREGESEEEVVVGTIPCHIEQVDEAILEEHVSGDNNTEKEVVVGTIPCLLKQAGGVQVEGKITGRKDKEMQVYKRKHFRR